MKLLNPSLTLAVALGALTLTPALYSAAPHSPGRVDFGKFEPGSSGAEYVEVNISSTLISMASQLVQKHEPEIASVINGLRGIKVNVVGIDDGNRDQLQKKAKDIRKQLADKGWEQIVTVRKQDQEVGIYLKTQDKDTVEGLTAVVFEGNKQAVFINVDGNIKPEQLSMLGERFHMEELKKAGKLSSPKSDAESEKQ